MSELDLYKIPAIDTSLPQGVDNPADIHITTSGDVSGSLNSGLSEQQVRDIVGQNISTGLKEDQVRDIIGKTLAPTLGTIISEDQVRNIVSVAMRSTNVMTEDKVRAIVNSMQKFLTGQNIMVDGIQKSQNFLTGVSGWQIDAEGNAEFNDGTFRGTFNIGGTTITIDNTQDIQENLDIIDAAGGGTLYLQNGTYTLTSNILIPSGVLLKGVSRDGVILDCNTSYSVQIAGTNAYSTGTVTINNGSTGLVGSGTTWTSAMIGRYVLLDGSWYEITAFTDTTHITISTYEGTNLAGSVYVIATVNFTGSISTLTIQNATASGFVVQYSQEALIDDIYVTSCGTGINMDYVVFPRMLVTSNANGVNLDMNYVFGFTIDFCDFSYSTTGAGIVMTNSGNANMYSSSVTDNTGDGISMTSCKKIPIIGCDISGNGGQGIEMVSGCNDNQIIGGDFDGNTSDGIKLTASSDRNTISSVSILNNGGYGINIAASTCDGTQIIAPAFSNNTSGNINDSGTDTFTSPQDVFPQFGDGSDGDATIAGTTTLTSDMYYNDLVVTGTLNTANYRVFVKGTLSGNGTIQCNGNNASGQTGGTSLVGYFTTGAGANGAATQTSSGNPGFPGGNTSNITTALITTASSVGGVGGSNGVQIGGNPGTSGTRTTVVSKFGTNSFLTFYGLDISGTTFTKIISSIGGTGGGGGSRQTGGAAGNGGAGGGGGAPGGILALFCRYFTGTVTLRANGGNGGNGANGAANSGGGGAGGGGGNGGYILVIYGTKTWTGSYNVDGGTAGSAGTTDGGGTAPTAASNGAVGLYEEILVTNLT